MSNDSINAIGRAASQWRNIKPEAVAAGSPAQILYCIRDAQHDIVEALNEIDRLRAVIAEKDADIAHYVNWSQNMNRFFISFVKDR